jgi:hypothetical protein
MKRKLSFEPSDCGINTVAHVNGVLVALLMPTGMTFTQYKEGTIYSSMEEWKKAIREQMKAGLFDRRVESTQSYEAALKRLEKIAKRGIL